MTMPLALLTHARIEAEPTCLEAEISAGLVITQHEKDFAESSLEMVPCDTIRDLRQNK